MTPVQHGTPTATPPSAVPLPDVVVPRRAEERDLGGIVRLLGDDTLGKVRETMPGDGTSDVADCYRLAFAALSADPHQLQAVVEIDGRIVGCMQLTFIPGLSQRGAWRAQIEGVRIASDQRNRGLGQIMITWAIAEARTRGCRTVQLTTNAVRTDAQRFYRRLGFVDSHIGMKLTIED